MSEGAQRWDKRLLQCLNDRSTRELPCPVSRSSVPGASSISAGTGCRPRCRSQSAIVSAAAVTETSRGSSRLSVLGLPSPACVQRHRLRGGTAHVGVDHCWKFYLKDARNPRL